MGSTTLNVWRLIAKVVFGLVENPARYIPSRLLERLKL